MRIAAWMKHPVVTVKPHDSARHAREVMEKHRINQLPVVIDDRLVGIVTDRDLRDAFPSVFESVPLVGRRRAQRGTDPAAIPSRTRCPRDDNLSAFHPPRCPRAPWRLIAATASPGRERSAGSASVGRTKRAEE